VNKAYIKICGVKDVKIAKHAINCGASFLGFIFFESSSRNISISKCAEILDEINGKVNTVAVTVNPTLSDLKTYSKMKFTHLQLHGTESLNEVRKINETYNLKLIKSFNISTESDLDQIKEYSPFIEHILLDSKQKKDMPGGTGQTFDWKIIRNFYPNKSFFLSGGLNTANITAALNLKKTEYFDVSSGVENSEGIKDEKLISEFISKANKFVK
jgi:phosphoribosylanthranilate isomerase